MAKKKAAMTDLAKGEERLAYWLLIPTFVIIVAIAFYPLGSVFFNSFTNKTFASATPTEAVGLENYKNLLSITIKQLPPVIDTATGQPAVDPETGAPSMSFPVSRAGIGNSRSSVCSATGTSWAPQTVILSAAYGIRSCLP